MVPFVDARRPAPEDRRTRASGRSAEDEALRRRFEQPSRGAPARAPQDGRAVARRHPRARRGRARRARTARSRRGATPRASFRCTTRTRRGVTPGSRIAGATSGRSSTSGARTAPFSNGQPCAGAILKPGDRIFIGKTVIEVQKDALRDAHAAELERLLSIDDLSGLWVRRRFDAQLESSVAAVLAGHGARAERRRDGHGRREGDQRHPRARDGRVRHRRGGPRHRRA